MPDFICKGAKLKCSFGSSQADLAVMHPPQTVSIGSGNMASMMDNKPMVNIQPFGQCKSLANPTVAAATAANQGVLKEMPCIPNTVAPWTCPKTDVLVKGQPAITTDSKLMCMWAGMIEITSSGQ